MTDYLDWFIAYALGLPSDFWQVTMITTFLGAIAVAAFFWEEE